LSKEEGKKRQTIIYKTPQKTKNGGIETGLRTG
jgi:hypothetical protein